MYVCILYIYIYIYITFCAQFFPFPDLLLLPTDTTHISLIIVSTETRYGLDGPGIEFRWKPETENENRPDRPWGPPSLLHNQYDIPVEKSGQGVVLTTRPNLAPRLKKW